MTEQWVIDGYNLLNAFPECHSGKPKPTREDFLAALSGFASHRQAQMLVVLDGTGDPSELDVFRTERFRVVYSLKVSADSCIERTLFESADPSRCSVVTNDRAITAIARGKGASVVPCAEFFRMWSLAVGEQERIRHQNEARNHGFNRPFDHKLKDL